MGIWDIIAGPILKIIDKVVPDPAAKAQATYQLMQLQQAGEFKDMEVQLAMVTAQTDVNKVEAANASLFVSGWRPFVGWVCGVGLSVQFLVGPLFTWIATLVGHPTPFPPIDTSTLITMLGGLLGLGGLRTVEKIQGVARK